jgi:LPXTG-motif cell wall-anchored protein
MAASPAGATSQACTPADAVYEQVSHTDYSWTLQFQYDQEDGVPGLNYTSWANLADGVVVGVGGSTVVQTDNNTAPTPPSDGSYDLVGYVGVGSNPVLMKFRYNALPDYHYTVDGELISAEVFCEWYTWDTQGYFPSAVDGGDVSWPQTLVGAGQISPETCETTYQQDLYKGTREQIDAVLDGNLLEDEGAYYEDHLLVKSWVFVSTDECIEVTEGVVDMCTNLDGNQEEVPEGYTFVDGICVKGSTPTLTEVTLAATGASETSFGAAAALALLLGGLGLTLLRRRVASE